MNWLAIFIFKNFTRKVMIFNYFCNPKKLTYFKKIKHIRKAIICIFIDNIVSWLNTYLHVMNKWIGEYYQSFFFLFKWCFFKYIFVCYQFKIRSVQKIYS